MAEVIVSAASAASLLENPAERAAHGLFDLGHELRAIAELVDEVSEESVKNCTLSTCVRTMLPEMYRQIDEAVTKLGYPVFGGFVDTYCRARRGGSSD